MARAGYDDVLARLEELERRVAQMVIRGKVSAVDHGRHVARVSYGDGMTTAWLQWKPIRTGKATVWWAPEVGEGVTVISDGDLSLGEILPGSYHDAMPAPSSDPDLFLIEWGDGSTLSHHRGDKHFDLNVAGPGTATVTAEGGVLINGNTKIVGNVEVVGNVHSTGGMAADGNVSSKGSIKADGNVSDGRRSMQGDRDIYNDHDHGGSKVRQQQ